MQKKIIESVTEWVTDGQSELLNNFFPKNRHKTKENKSYYFFQQRLNLPLDKKNKSLGKQFSW